MQNSPSFSARSLLLAAALLLLAACTIDKRTGSYACENDSQCPRGWHCIDQRCDDHAAPVNKPDAGDAAIYQRDATTSEADGSSPWDAGGSDAAAERDAGGCQAVSINCGPYVLQACPSGRDQSQCPSSCENTRACRADAHCDPTSHTCEWNQTNGAPCKGDSECSSGHCERGLCCEDGDCCVRDDMCSGNGSVTSCDDPATCSGSISVTGCMDFQCKTVKQSNGSACDGLGAERCGSYADTVCQGGARAQCGETCATNSQCAADAYCKPKSEGGSCEAKLPDGSACTDQAQCQTGCNHGFCCAATSPDTYCCSSNADCKSLEAMKCVDDPNVCDGVILTAQCSAEHRCVVTSKPGPNACTNRVVPCGAAYRASAQCPLGCGCSADYNCSDPYFCSKPATANWGVCQKRP